MVRGRCRCSLRFVELMNKVIIYKDRMLISLHTDQKTPGNVEMAGQPPQFMLVWDKHIQVYSPKCF